MPKPRDDKQRGSHYEKENAVAVVHDRIIALGPFSNRSWSLLLNRVLKGPVPIIVGLFYPPYPNVLDLFN